MFATSQALMLASAALLQAEAEIPRVTVAQIAAAWNARAVRVQSVELEWATKFVDLRRDPRRTMERTSLVRVDRTRRFLKSTGEQWGSRKLGVVPLHHFDSFVPGQGYRMMIGPPGTPTCMIDDNDEGLTTSALYPALWAVSRLSIVSDKSKIESEDAECRGKRTVLLRDSRWSQVEHLYWLDPAADLSVRRVDTLARPSGFLLSRCDIDTFEREPGIYLPKSWTYQRFDRNSIHSDQDLEARWESRLIRSEVNRQYRDEDFRVEFPPGIKVIDQRRGAARPRKTPDV